MMTLVEELGSQPALEKEHVCGILILPISYSASIHQSLCLHPTTVFFNSVVEQIQFYFYLSFLSTFI